MRALLRRFTDWLKKARPSARNGGYWDGITVWARIFRR